MELTFPLCFTLVTIILITIIFRWSTSSITKKTSQKPPLPPSPRGFPVIGNLPQLGHHPHRSLRSLALRYGPLMLLRLGHVPVLVVSSADVAQDVLKTHDRAFASRPKSKVFDKLLYDRRNVAFAPYGEPWRQKKSICVLHLLSNKMVRSFQIVRDEEIKLVMKKIEIASSAAAPVNLNELFVALTNGVICRAALGRKYTDREGTIDVKDFMGKLMELIGGFNVGDYIPWLTWIDKIRGLNDEVERTAKKIDEFLERVIEEHSHNRNYQAQSNIIDVLLSIQNGKLNGFEIDKVDVKAIILDVFVGGTETSYATLEWTMAELLRRPDVMNKLRNEIHTFSKSKSYVSEDEIQNMKYLRAVIKEVLRLHPPVPLLAPRESIQDVILKGYAISANTQVLINAWALGREVATWGEDVEDFRPERFLDSSIDFRGHDFSFVPFGAGRRGCPGIAFAMAVIELTLANIVYWFDWKMVNGNIGESDIAETPGIAIHPRFPLIAFASPTSDG